LPLIEHAEVRVQGSRKLKPIALAVQFREADRYEVAGVIDVVTHVKLGDPTLASNPLVQTILAQLPAGLPAAFEIIIDYKGTRRPSTPAGPLRTGRTSWRLLYEWQLQTYAYLRSRQPGSLPVVAGVLLYLNEMMPTASDLRRLQREIALGTADVVPTPGSAEARILAGWRVRPKRKVPILPLDFRLRRAVHVLPVDPVAIIAALNAFDDVVKDIETCRGREAHGATIQSAWPANASELQNCQACDHRTYCPEYQRVHAPTTGLTRPRLPGVNPRMGRAARSRGRSVRAS
jgi:hypothetical protein